MKRVKISLICIWTPIMILTPNKSVFRGNPIRLLKTDHDSVIVLTIMMSLMIAAPTGVTVKDMLENILLVVGLMACLQVPSYHR